MEGGKRGASHAKKSRSLLFALALAVSMSAACRSRPELSAQDIANYAGRVTFSNLRVGASENIAKQTVYYLDADVKNGGDRTITQMTVNASFRSIEGQVIARQPAVVVHPQRKALAAGESRSVRLGFEGIPDTWNRAAPALEITRLMLD
ncbi:MAG: hypothetical protein ACREUU_10645 [Gammaproteobacteria bacterium]